MDDPNLDQFQYWLAHMDDALSQFKSMLPENIEISLDLTVNSLDLLEEVILDKYKNPNELKAPQSKFFLDGSSRYFGEVLRISTQSKWSIEYEDKSFVFYGLPILAGGKLGKTPICPLTTITACADRRNGFYLSKIVKNMM